MERFLVRGDLRLMTWDEALKLALFFRVKTSLALTRHRARKAMEKWMK
jgi:hypothetical protein